MPEEIKAQAVMEAIDALRESAEKTGADSAETKEMLDKVQVDLKATVENAQKQTEQLAEMRKEAEAAEKRSDFLEKMVIRGNGESSEDGNKAYDDGMARYLRKGEAIDPEEVARVVDEMAKKVLIGATENDVELLKKDLLAGSNPDGGFFLTTDRSASVSKRIFETSPLRALASVQTTNSDLWEIPLDDDEADCGWVGEVDLRPDTDTPQIGLVKIPIHELYAQPKATQKIIDDSGFNIVSWLEGKVSMKMGRQENTAFVLGDASQKPKGFLTYDAWASAGTYERDAVEQIATAGSGAIVGNDMIKLQGSLITNYQEGAVFGMKRATFWNNILTLKDTQGQYLMNSRILSEGGQMMLLGNPVVLMDDMPAVAASALSIVYADFKEFYTIVDRFGIRVLRDPYTTKPYTKFYTTKRVGAAVTNYEAGKLLKITA